MFHLKSFQTKAKKVSVGLFHRKTYQAQDPNFVKHFYNLEKLNDEYQKICKEINEEDVRFQKSFELEIDNYFKRQIVSKFPDIFQAEFKISKLQSEFHCDLQEFISPIEDVQIQLSNPEITPAKEEATQLSVEPSDLILYTGKTCHDYFRRSHKKEAPKVSRFQDFFNRSEKGRRGCKVTNLQVYQPPVKDPYCKEPFTTYYAVEAESLSGADYEIISDAVPIVEEVDGWCSDRQYGATGESGTYFDHYNFGNDYQSIPTFDASWNSSFSEQFQGTPATTWSPLNNKNGIFECGFSPPFRKFGDFGFSSYKGNRVDTPDFQSSFRSERLNTSEYESQFRWKQFTKSFEFEDQFYQFPSGGASVWN